MHRAMLATPVGLWFHRTLATIVLSTNGANASEIAKSSVNNARLSLIFDWWMLFQQIHLLGGGGGG